MSVNDSYEALYESFKKECSKVKKLREALGGLINSLDQAMPSLMRDAPAIRLAEALKVLDETK